MKRYPFLSLISVVVCSGMVGGGAYVVRAQSGSSPSPSATENVKELFQQYNRRELALSDLFDRLSKMNDESVRAAARSILSSDYRTLKKTLRRERLREKVLPDLRKKMERKRRRVLSLIRDEERYGRSGGGPGKRKISRAAMTLFTFFRKPLVFYMRTREDTGSAFFRSVALIQYYRRQRMDPPSPTRRILELIRDARDVLTTDRVGRAPSLQPHEKANRRIEKKNADRASALSDQEKKLVELVNTYRELYGLRKLIIHEKLTAAARRHARSMKENGRITHQSGGSGNNPVLRRLENEGFSARKAGENVARGSGSPMSILKGWIQSPEHHRNLLVENYRFLGLAREGNYWTLDMATVPRVKKRR